MALYLQVLMVVIICSGKNLRRMQNAAVERLATTGASVPNTIPKI